MKFKAIVFLFALSFFIPLVSVKADTTADSLNGRILLQVESKGEAWYVNPKDGKRYYMANGDEAYNVMRGLGVGITNKDLEKIKNNKSLAIKQKGKIFLQVESKGEAYYIDFNGNTNYLKNGFEAYTLMRKLGLGITNKNLENISLGSTQKESVAATITSIGLIPAKEFEKSVEDNISKTNRTFYITLDDGTNKAFYIVNKFNNSLIYLGKGASGWENYFYYINHNIFIKNEKSENFDYLSINLKKIEEGSDNDKDGLPNIAEYIFGTDKNNTDSDGDLYSDSAELMGGYDPTKKSSNLSLYMEPNITDADKSLFKSQYKYNLEGKNSKAIDDIKKIQTGLEMYYNQIGYYPESLSLISSMETYYKPTDHYWSVLKDLEMVPQSPEMDKTICPDYQGYKYNRTGEYGPLPRKESTYELNYCTDIPLKSQGVKAGIKQASQDGLFKK